MKEINVLSAFVVSIAMSGQGIAFPAHDGHSVRNGSSTFDRTAQRPLMLAEQGTAGKGILLTPVPGLSGDGKWTMPAPAPGIAAGYTPPPATGKTDGAVDSSDNAARGESSARESTPVGPSVDKTPSPGGPVPVPYPNAGGPSKGKAPTKPELAKGVAKMPAGQPGIAKRPGGGSFTHGSAPVKVQGQKAVHMGSMTGHNGSSANAPPGAQLAPSQTKVKVAP